MKHNLWTLTDGRLPVEIWEGIFHRLVDCDLMGIGTEWKSGDIFHTENYEDIPPKDPMSHLRYLRTVSKAWNWIIIRISSEWIRIRNIRCVDSTLKWRNQYPQTSALTKRIDLLFSPFPDERPFFAAYGRRKVNETLNNLAKIFKESSNLKIITVSFAYRYEYRDE